MNLFTALGLIFVTLKLTNYVDWSWIWVTMPFWGGWFLVFVWLVIADLHKEVSTK